MIQPLPRVQQHVSFAINTDHWTVNDGTQPDSGTAGPNIARIPLPWAVTAQNFTVISHDTTRAHDATITLLKNGSATTVTVDLPFASDGPVSDLVHTATYAALDDWSYEVAATAVGSGGNTFAWSIEADNAGNVFGVGAATGTGRLDEGWIAGALGNGFWQTFVRTDPYSRSTSYSICATPGDLTVLCAKYFGTTPIPGGASWIAYYVLNGVVQDGSGGTVDTRCTIAAASTTGTASFTLPIVKGDHVEVAVYWTGVSPGAFEAANVAVGVGFIPTTDGYFMLTGGSNDVIGAPTGYVWVLSAQDLEDEPLAQAPITLSGLIARGLYVERAAPGTGESFDQTVRHSAAPTAIIVTLVDLETSGLIEDQYEAYVDGDTIDLQSVASLGATPSSRLYWGLEASIGGDVPTFGTLIVTKDAGGDTETPFTIEVGGGLIPASPALVGGASQVYGEVPAGSGYSVAEPVVPDGWQLVSVTVSNGSPPDSLIVSDGETVTVTFVNSQVPTTTPYAIRRLRRAPHLSSEQFWQFFAQLQIGLQTGVGTSTGQGADPQLMLRWSDDGGATWSHEHWVSAGKIGEYTRRAIWRRLGRGRDRVFEVTMTDPVFWALVEAELQVTRGSS